MIISIEMKYSNLIRNRMDKIEAFMEDLAMEQANLNGKVAAFSFSEPNAIRTEDSKFEENGLFPNTLSSVHVIDNSTI